MQPQGQEQPPVGIIFDCGLGASIDEVLALALLYGLDSKSEARVISLSVSKPNLKAAALCEAIARFYGGASSGAFGAVGRTMPVGLADEGKSPEDTPMLTVPLSRRNGEGAPLYSHGIEKLTDTAEVRALIRNALTQQPDQNSVVVLTGPATNLARTLNLPGVKDLIARKAQFLSVAGGAYPDGPPQFNIKADIAAARKLFAEWPTPIVATGDEIGASLLFPASSIEKDFAWSPAHPVVDAYRAYKPMPYDAPTCAMAALLYAIRPQEGYFKLSEPGTISVLDDGRTKFTPSPEGKHRYLILDPEQKERVIKTYTEIASAKPAPRQPRRRQQQQQQQQQTPPKPPTPKPQQN
ncbi:MAG TPA: nucleoside hydrolase [Candidatus Binatia bacterium]|nr:nucleoside hydrolase [Candidatus Binatia bacterium]